MYRSMRESKKRVIIVIIILMLLILLLVTGILVYLKTDLFKSDEGLFKEYFIQNLNSLNNIIDMSKEKEYIKVLEEKDYNEDTTINFDYTNNEGQEEAFTGNITGVKNCEQNKSYKDCKVKLGDTNIIEVKYLQENNLHGLQFVDIANTYAAVDISKSISEVIKYWGLESIFTSDKINLVNVSELIDLSEEDKQNILTKYLSVILSKVEKNDYSSPNEKMITLSNGQSVTSNCYILTISQDKLQQIYIEILEQLKNDTTIISKVENIDNKIKEIGINLNKDLKTLFIDNIDQRINDANIQDQLTIGLYETNKRVVRSVLQYGNKAVTIDFNNENNIEAQIYKVLEGQASDITTISIDKNEDATKIIYNDFENRNIEINRNITNNTNNIKSTISVQYGDNNIKNLQVSIDQNLNLGEASQIEESFEQTTKRILNEYDYEKLDYALGSLGDMILNKLIEKRDDTNSLILNSIIEYFNSQERQKIEEQNRIRRKFNNQFVPYTGNDLEIAVVYNLLDEVGENILNYQSIGDNEIRIYIKEGNENKELSEEIKKKLDENQKYNIKVEYDENNFVSQVIIEVVSQEQ